MNKVSYALGLSIGNNFRNAGIHELNTEDFVRALNSVLNDEEPEISYDDAKQVVNEYFAQLQEDRYENNRAAGAEYQMINGQREGVTTLASGVQYSVLKHGNGPKPTANDTVKCHYEGSLINGTVFDSSIKRGEPATFPVNGVIKGWQEVLQLMSVGDKWRVVIPYQYAYGEHGAGQAIEPYSTLVFDIELLGIE